MKKSLALVLLCVFMLSFVFGENDTPVQNLGAPNLGNIGEGLNDQTKDLLENNIQIPALFSPFTTLMGLNTDTDWRQVIVFITIFLMIFTIILSIARLLPFFGDKAGLRVLFSFVVTCLVAVSHGIIGVVNFSLSIIDMIMPKNSSDVIDLALIILGALILAFLLNMITKKWSKQSKLDNAKETGIKVGAALSAIKEEGKNL